MITDAPVAAPVPICTVCGGAWIDNAGSCCRRALADRRSFTAAEIREIREIIDELREMAV